MPLLRVEISVKPLMNRKTFWFRAVLCGKRRQLYA